MLVTMVKKIFFAVNGNWGAWSSYSTCSVTCGNGNMTSTRTCDSPAPVHGGNDCHGDAIRMKSCHHAPCKGNVKTHI